MTRRRTPTPELIDARTRRAAGRVQGLARAGLVTGVMLRSGERLDLYAVPESLYQWLAVPALVLLCIVLAPIARRRWREHDLESSIFFLQVFAIGAVALAGASWAAARLGVEHDTYLAPVAWAVLLPPVWLVALLVSRLWRRLRRPDRVRRHGRARAWRRRLVMAGCCLGAGALAWQVATMLDARAELGLMAVVCAVGIVAFHFVAVVATNIDRNVFNPDAYTPESIVGDFTGEGIATLGQVRADLRRRLSSAGRRTRSSLLLGLAAALVLSLIAPGATAVVVAVAATIAGWVCGRAAQRRLAASSVIGDEDDDSLAA
jgi:hypothetical protein